MNRVKLTIKDADHKLLCKIGTSFDPPAGEEYSDVELCSIISEFLQLLNTKTELNDD
jgi:hypothetical protein